MNSLISLAKSHYKNYDNNKIISTNNFKDQHSFEKRVEEASRIMTKYPDRIPIICERLTKKIEQVDRKKYLCPVDLTLGNFLFVIRKRLKLSSDKAIYLFINNSILPVSHNLGAIYDQYKDEDGFLYIRYDSESTFG